MPYQRPTLVQLRQQALQDVQNGGIPGVVAVLRFSVLYVLCMVLAGLAWLHYGYIDWISKQAVPWTATDEYLEAWAALKKIFRIGASTSSGVVTFPVSGTGIVPAGTQILLTGGVTVMATSDSVTSGTNAVVNCASITTGAAANIVAGAIATLSSPVPYVQSTGTVTTAFTGGADQETDDSLRARMLIAFQSGDENGAEADYIGWAKAVAGVTRAWVNRNGFGAGTVVIYVMLDNAEAANGGFPVGTNGSASAETRYATATGDQLLVANAVYTPQPVTALVIVCSPIPQPVAFTVSSLGANNTQANQAAITGALQDMFTRLSAPGETIYPNYWNEAIGALGLSTFNVSSPSGPVAGTTIGSMPTLGTVTFES